MPISERNPISRAPGLVLHRPVRYDLVIWLWTLGRERAFREKLLSVAKLVPGERILDVGCGTGGLALAAKQQVGSSGRVYGVDASPEMIARATRKAARAGIEVDFQNAVAQTLPFADAQFDVVLTTVMLHHLPRPDRQHLISEAQRVLRPGGRLLAIDFAKPATPRRGMWAHVHRHGHIDLDELIAIVSAVGLRLEESGDVGKGDLKFVLATKP